MKTSRLKDPKIVFLLASFCCLLWGSAAPFIKIGYRYFQITGDDLWSMTLFAGCRFSLAGVLVILYASIRNRRLAVPARGNWYNAFMMGLASTFVQYLFNFIGVGHCSGVNASILNGTGNLISILLACSVFHQEKFTTRKVLGCVLGVGGVLMMNLGAEAAPFTFLGEGCMLIAGLSGGVGFCQGKVYSRNDDAVVLTGWQFLMGGLLLILVSLPLGGRLNVAPAAGYGALFYLGLASAVAFSLWNLLMKLNSVSAIAVYGFLIPIFGVLISAVLLGEFSQLLRVGTLAALALVCLGVLTVNLPAKDIKSVSHDK